MLEREGKRDRDRDRVRVSERASERETNSKTDQQKKRERYEDTHLNKEKKAQCAHSLFLRKLCLQILLVSSVCPIRQAAAYAF
jgi:hypothetical protein